MTVTFEKLSTPEGLKKLDQYLASRSYISGYQASRDDLVVFVAVESVPAEYVNAARWFKHISALAGPQFAAPGAGVQIESGAAPAAAPKEESAPSPVEAKAASPPAADDDDDDLDLFGDETEEEKAAAEKREADKKKSTKPKVIAKSSIVMDVKPWDDETDMAKLEAAVRAVQMEGLHWGASKLVTVVAGIKKLSIMLTVVDDLVSIDNLIEDHLTSEPNDEYIQSCDIVAFNKISKPSYARSSSHFAETVRVVVFFERRSLSFSQLSGGVTYLRGDRAADILCFAQSKSIAVPRLCRDSCRACRYGDHSSWYVAMAKSKAVLMIVGDYVEDYEVMVPFQGLLAFGLKVDAVCPGKKAGETCATAIHDFLGHQTYSESKGHNFVLTANFKDVNADSYDALVVPGGRAPEYLSLDEDVLNLVKNFESAHKPIASICHGQLILAAAGILKDKQCTAYPAVKPVVVAAGGIWKDPSPISACFTDGNLVTGAAWPGHPEFLKQILKVLSATVQGGNKKILMLCGDYMEDYEAMVPFQTMQALGYQVDAVCPDKKAGDTCATAVHDFEGAQTYSEKPGHNFALTATFSETRASDYDALFVPGGRAPEYLSLNEKVLDVVREFDNAKKPIASICHGQQILAAAGVLKGKKCTAYPAVKSQVVLSGGHWLDADPITKCFTDGHLVTGAAWPAHPDFIAQLMALLETTVTF